VGQLAGMRVTDPVTGAAIVSQIDSRLRAWVMLGAPGNGADLAPFATAHYPVLGGTTFNSMTAPVLVVAGDQDRSDRFSAQADWRTDAYHCSPGPKCLFTVLGSGHMLGGISGYDVAETDDENPARVAFVRQTILAYLRTALNPDDASWDDAQQDLQAQDQPQGRIECK
jgi:hypothetical protein